MTELTPDQERTLEGLMDASSAKIYLLEDAKNRGEDPATIKTLAAQAAEAEGAVLQYEVSIGITGQSLAITAYSAGSLLVDAQEYGQALITLYSARVMAETDKLRAELTDYATKVRQMAAAQAVELGKSQVAIQMSQAAGQQFLQSIRSGDPKVTELVELLGMGDDASVIFFIEGEAEPIDLKAAMEAQDS